MEAVLVIKLCLGSDGRRKFSSRFCQEAGAGFPQRAGRAAACIKGFTTFSSASRAGVSARVNGSKHHSL